MSKYVPRYFHPAFVSLVVVLTIALAGCSTWQAAAVGIDAQAETVVQNVAKDRLAVSIQSICHTGYDTLLIAATQAPQISVGVESFCGKLPVTTTQTVITPVSPTLFLGPAQVKMSQ